MTPEPDYRKALRHNLREVLRQWHTPGIRNESIERLALFRALHHPGDSPILTLKQLLQNALTLLAERAPKQADLLRQHYLAGELVSQLVRQMDTSESKFYEWQNAALDQLTTIVQEMDEEARAARRAELQANLPDPTYLSLIGAAERMAALREVVTRADTPWIILLEGIGGIGKTSLANALARELVGETRFEAVGWVSTQRAFFDFGGAIQATNQPALTVATLVDQLLVQLAGEEALQANFSTAQKLATLKARLKAQPHLIVIDNLETFEDVAELLPTLKQLMAPSKFLLTSRYSFPPQPHLHRMRVPPLGQAHALQLVRQTAEMADHPTLQNAPEEDLLPIYHTVGGNPLALRLVVGQSYFHGLDAVLADLSAARGERVEMLYTYIYRQVWEQLAETTRQVFLAMPIMTEAGGDLTFLEEITRLDVAALRPALEELVTLNLVDVSDGPHVRRYSIHSLTRAFLQEQVIKWM